MPDTHSRLILTGHHQGLDYISIYENGLVCLRHRSEFGNITNYEQSLPHVAKTILDSGVADQWLPAIFDVPEDLRPHFAPASVVMIQRPGSGLTWDFLFPRMPCSRVLSHLLLFTYIDAKALCNNGTVMIPRNPRSYSTHVSTPNKSGAF